jgi:hypothetical protein
VPLSQSTATECYNRTSRDSREQTGGRSSTVSSRILQHDQHDQQQQQQQQRAVQHAQR